MKAKDTKKRNDYIVEQFLSPNNRTMQDIGDEFGISRERIRQILKDNNVSATAGGATARGKLRREREEQELADRTERRYYRTYGCDEKTVREINGGRELSNNRSPAARYKFYKWNLKRLQGLECAMSLPEWYSVWQKSGHYSDDSLRTQYGMVVVDKTKPVTADNVKIMKVKNAVNRNKDWYDG